MENLRAFDANVLKKNIWHSVFTEILLIRVNNTKKMWKKKLILKLPFKWEKFILKSPCN